LTKESIPFRTTMTVLLLAALWGGNVVAIKIGLRGIPPLAAAGIRFCIALPLVALWARLRSVSVKPRAGEIFPLLVIALLFTFQIAVLNWGTRLTLAGRATVILHTYPVFVAFLAHFMIPGERLSWYRLVGVILAFAGIVAVFWEKLALGTGETVPGDLLCLGSAFLLGLLNVLLKRYLQTIDEARVLVWEMIIGVPLFFALHLLFDRGSAFTFSPDVVTALLYQGVIVGVFCFLIWLSILKRHSPSRLTVLFFTAPLWGLLASYLLLGEGISIGLAVGAGMVALGIFLVNRG
jgi:drug/metabolite transporter (DMT)-like permease